MKKQTPAEPGAEPCGPGLRCSILERFTESKTGNPADNEDAIVITAHHIAVIDGATSTAEDRREGKTPGRLAADLIGEAFQNLDPCATAREAVDLFAARIGDFSTRHAAANIIAAFAAVSLRRREVWLVGDCQVMLDDEKIAPEKKIDRLLSEVRAVYLEAEILGGRTMADLLKQDGGREFILPLIRRQVLFQNDPSRGEYWYPAVSATPAPDEGILVRPVPDGTRHIVLASDGYPDLKDSLEGAETRLKEILAEDPLLFRTYKSTKGRMDANLSFDDRSFVKLRIE